MKVKGLNYFFFKSLGTNLTLTVNLRDPCTYFVFTNLIKIREICLRKKEQQYGTNGVLLYF